jgi:glycosyltransferase involved in cell wall biosynthesis
LPTQKEQILLFDNPFTTADTLNDLNLTLREKLTHYMRNKIFLWRSRYIDMFLVQTEVQQKRLIKRLRNNTPVKYLPNASANITNPCVIDITTESDRSYYLAFTRYYSHKNIEILIDVAKQFRNNNINKTIILTIDESQGRKAKKILLKIKKLNLEKYIFTIGRVDFNQIASLYSKVDALILPTLLESYSSTYADAMLYKKIIYTSDRDFAHEVCKDSAFYFNPLSDTDIYNTIIESDKNPELIEQKKSSGSKIAGNSVNWEESILSLFNDLRIKL